MKKTSTRIAAVICTALAFAINANAQDTKTWDFTVLSDADRAAIEANITNKGGAEWQVDASSTSTNTWWSCKLAVGQNSAGGASIAYADLYLETATKPLYTDYTTKAEAEYTKGLHFGAWAGGSETTPAATKALYGNFRIQANAPRIYMAAANGIIVIPALVAGDSVIVTMAGNSSTTATYFQSMNLYPEYKPQDSNYTAKFTRKSKVVKDGNVVLRSTNGCYVYDITVKDKDGNVKTKEQIIEAAKAAAIATGIKGVSTNAATQTVDNKVYDLSGRYVGTDLTNLPQGMYIVNGKKVVK